MLWLYGPEKFPGLSRNGPQLSLVQSIRTKIQEVNSKLSNHLHQIKAHKFEQLTGPSKTCNSSLESLSTVVTIPENFPLSDEEKSVLSKGLNFVPNTSNKDIFETLQTRKSKWTPPNVPMTRILIFPGSRKVCFGLTNF